MFAAAAWLAVLGIAGQAWAHDEEPAAARPKPFVMGFDEDAGNFGSAWSLRIYAEAFKRMGVPWKPGFFPLARRAILVDEGAIDGDGARVYDYLSSHPNLVRVEESVMEFGFGLFSANPKVALNRIEDLAASSYLVEYRRGIHLCETRLKQIVPDKNLSNITTERQGLRKLLAGRTDLYCDLETVVEQALRSDEFRADGRIRKVIGIGNSATYPYLHKKHAALAPRLAETLKQMKAEGLVERYRREAEREAGVDR
jgi:polar amino acid transport system substrate-binding protein